MSPDITGLPHANLVICCSRGAIGACLRFGISELMALLLGPISPTAPWWVNVVGSFIMGIAFALLITVMWWKHPINRC